MEGLRVLTLKETQDIKGGYIFTCPVNETILINTLEKFKRESKEKAAAYIKFCYEVCGYT